MQLSPFKLETDYRARVWGGRRLRPSSESIGEAWAVYERNLVLDGPLAGRTLAEAAGAGADLLGAPVVAHTGRRFPLLIKLLDTADWLSVQVHPNDADARALEGDGQWGKAEAWHILSAEPDARVVCGVWPGTDREQLAGAIQCVQGSGIQDLLAFSTVASGDTIDVPPGQLHALGPGLLLYEVQQTSDITYRVYDWDRPPQEGRALHVEQSLAVVDPELMATPKPSPADQDGSPALLLENDLFHLTALRLERQPVDLATGRCSFHAVTVIEGAICASADGWHSTLDELQTLIVPACADVYRVEALQASARVLIAQAV
jgi:mannose-6-phosphate isomerase